MTKRTVKADMIERVDTDDPDYARGTKALETSGGKLFNADGSEFKPKVAPVRFTSSSGTVFEILNQHEIEHLGPGIHVATLRVRLAASKGQNRRTVLVTLPANKRSLSKPAAALLKSAAIRAQGSTKGATAKKPSGVVRHSFAKR